MGTKERFRLTLRWVCFALLLTAAALRLCAEIGWQGARQAWESLRSRTEEPSVSVSDVPNAETFPTMQYTPPAEQGTHTETASASVSIDNRAGVSFDAEELMNRPLPITQISDEPLILIVHTHATEAYTDETNVGSTYHTTDTNYNVVRVGQALADKLNACGIPTLHDNTLNDALGYNDAYERTEEVIRRYLEEYPSIQMVIDVHRDAVADENGAELAMTTELGGEPAAQLLFVMGTDEGGLEHPNWQENLSFAIKMQSFCSQTVSGLFRKLSLRASRYNQHLTPCSVLLEVGAAGNTLDEAIRSVTFFGEKLAELLQTKS